MKITDKKLLPCEQERERRSRLARQAIDECKQEKKDKDADDAAFWKVVYILVHVAAVLLVLTTLYRMWGK